MKLHDRIDDIEVEAENNRPHSLSRLVARLDEQLDIDRATQVRLIDRTHEIAQNCPNDPFIRDGIVAPLLAWATEAARIELQPQLARGRRPKLDRNVRWADEVEALQVFYAGQYVVRSGLTARIAERAQLGSVYSRMATVSMPEIDPYHDAVRRGLLEVGSVNGGVELLFRTYVELQAPRNRFGAKKNAGNIVGVDGGASATTIVNAIRRQEGILPHWSGLVMGPGLTASLLVAESLRVQPSNLNPSWGSQWALPVGLTDHQQQEWARRVSKATSRARATLREYLRGVEVNNNEESLLARSGDTPEMRVARTKSRGPRYIIPPRGLREIVQGEPQETIICCAGIGFFQGLRLDCRTVEVEGPVNGHPSHAWPSCTTCSLPTVPTKRR